MQDYRAYLEDLNRRLREAYAIAQEEHEIIGLNIRAIDPDAILWFRKHWQTHPRRILVDWDWAGDDHRPAKGWNAAIWLAGTLCGLASGHLTKNAVRMDYVERFPGENPLAGEVIPIALTVIDAYADLVGKTYLRVHDVSEGLLPTYERFGFELAPERARVHVVQRKRT